MLRLTVAAFRLQMRVDRTGDVDVRRCSVTDPTPAYGEDLSLPALPDIELFTFAGDYCL